MARLRLCCASGDRCDVRNAFGQERRSSDWPWYEAALACLRYVLAFARQKRVSSDGPWCPMVLIGWCGVQAAMMLVKPRCATLARVTPRLAWSWLRWDGVDDLEL